MNRIPEGKLAVSFKDNTLVNQDYIKDSKLSVYVWQSLDRSYCYGFQKAGG
jgi:elongation factor Ts